VFRIERRAGAALDGQIAGVAGDESGALDLNKLVIEPGRQI
jgi:hypothetical protein